jgi:uncharacterized membrane protein YbjE (DUF340 family)
LDDEQPEHDQDAPAPRERHPASARSLVGIALVATLAAVVHGPLGEALATSGGPGWWALLAAWLISGALVVLGTLALLAGLMALLGSAE